MSNYVKDQHKELHDLLHTSGSLNNKIQEIVGAHFSMLYEKTTFNAELETKAITELMGKANYHKKYAIEQHHYNMFEETLLHKLTEIEYYFNETLNSTRKCIAFSTDCISAINILQREDTLYAFFHLRSSDCENLLPIDLLHINLIINRIANRYDSVKNLSLHGTIASLHRYLNGGRSNASD